MGRGFQKRASGVYEESEIWRGTGLLQYIMRIPQAIGAAGELSWRVGFALPT